jgi:glycosyltransferase involved in cell wall biosynthesis
VYPLVPLRIALFTDSFHEANGVATLSREFEWFAKRRQLPLFSVHSGPKTRVIQEGTVTTVELKRGFASFPLDHDLDCDLLLNRYRNWVMGQLRQFRPDVIHITGPGDMGVMGFWISHLLQVPMVASWHTNLHEYAAQRLEKAFSFLPDGWRERISSAAEHQALRACTAYYRLARFTLAPNETMVHLLSDRTHRPSYLMAHGVDTERFSPCRRVRGDAAFRIGYVGRLTPEKNVRLFAQIEKKLRAAGEGDFRLVLVGAGSEKEWLQKNLASGELPGVLRGDRLAEAFAGMDAFVFPSRTDTFGLVLLEAMASGVPVIVSPQTGARVGIQDGSEGIFADDAEGMTAGILRLMREPDSHGRMSCAARVFASSKGWSGVFEKLYETYEEGLERIGRLPRAVTNAG